MSMRTLPLSERIFATLVLLALATALGMGLVSTHARELRPPAPDQVPAGRPRLMAVLEGVMAPNVSPAETAQFKAWVDAGATREGFAPVESVVTNNCASCHGEGGQFPRILGFEDLRPLALEAAPEGLTGLLDARFLHLFAFPLIFLVGTGVYLRRIAWAGRKVILGGCALAVLGDAAQWWLRQGRPEALWAAWMGMAALAGAMAVLTTAVLWDLWEPESR